MNRSRLIIGVMGGCEQRDAAHRLGDAIVARDQILLTGGRIEDSVEVKDAAMFGAARTAKSRDCVARLVGILPGGTPRWVPRVDRHERSLFVETGLTSAERDCITGTTPDALIVLKGSTGTLTELAFANALGRPIWFLSSRKFLIDKTREHGPSGGRSSGDGKLASFLADAARVYSAAAGRPIAVAELEVALCRSLDEGEEYAEGEEALVVAEVIRRASRTSVVKGTFPGIPRAAEMTRRAFETALRVIDG